MYERDSRRQLNPQFLRVGRSLEGWHQSKSGSGNIIQVLTQSIEDSLEPRVEFFMVEMGVTKEKLAKMVTRHPQLLHYSVEDGICPRVDYLKSIGLSKDDILKVFARLTQVQQ